MEPILRALICYLLLLVVVRLSGKRGLAQVTIFGMSCGGRPGIWVNLEARAVL